MPLRRRPPARAFPTISYDSSAEYVSGIEKVHAAAEGSVDAVREHLSDLFRASGPARSTPKAQRTRPRVPFNPVRFQFLDPVHKSSSWTGTLLPTTPCFVPRLAGIRTARR
jgi:hypothetical protein